MSHQDTKRIAKNTIFLYVRMIITMLITLYTSRVILNVLGVEDYGVYNIIAGIVVLLAFLQTAMTMPRNAILHTNWEKGSWNQ